MKATIFAIGCSVGKDSYKDTGVSMNPHFSAAEGAAAIEKGLFDVQSHGFNMHEVSGLDPDPVRYGILQKAGESEAEYVAFIRSDCEKMKDILGSMGSGLGVMAYPFGVYNDISEVVMAGEGVYASVSTKAHMNTVIKGLPQSLRCLGRFGMAKDISAEEMLRMIEE